MNVSTISKNIRGLRPPQAEISRGPRGEKLA